MRREGRPLIQAAKHEEEEEERGSSLLQLRATSGRAEGHQLECKLGLTKLVGGGICIALRASKSCERADGAMRGRRPVKPETISPRRRRNNDHHDTDEWSR